MLRFLSEENINLLEDFIISNKPKSNTYLPAISERDRTSAISDWKTITDPLTSRTTYLQFASNGSGMSSYAFYKSRNGCIYLISAFCNELTCYYENIPSNWYILMPREECFM
jgi:hypothetical protein